MLAEGEVEVRCLSAVTRARRSDNSHLGRRIKNILASIHPYLFARQDSGGPLPLLTYNSSITSDETKTRCYQMKPRTRLPAPGGEGTVFQNKMIPGISLIRKQSRWGNFYCLHNNINKAATAVGAAFFSQCLFHPTRTRFFCT